MGSTLTIKVVRIDETFSILAVASITVLLVFYFYCIYRATKFQKTFWQQDFAIYLGLICILANLGYCSVRIFASFGLALSTDRSCNISMHLMNDLIVTGKLFYSLTAVARFNIISNRIKNFKIKTMHCLDNFMIGVCILIIILEGIVIYVYSSNFNGHLETINNQNYCESNAGWSILIIPLADFLCLTLLIIVIMLIYKQLKNIQHNDEDLEHRGTMLQKGNIDEIKILMLWYVIVSISACCIMIILYICLSLKKSASFALINAVIDCVCIILYLKPNCKN